MADPGRDLTGAPPPPAVFRTPSAYLAGGVGGLLWVQSSFGAGALLLAGEPTPPGHALACLVAGFVLVGGLWRRNAAALMLAFPAALLLCVQTMPAVVREAAFEPARWVPWAVTFAAWLVAASTWLAQLDQDRFGVSVGRTEHREIGRPVSLFTRLRIVAALALLVLPAAALVFRRPGPHFATDGPPELMLAHLALTFGFCVAVYAAYVGPMLDTEPDRRSVGARLETPPSPSRRHARLLGWWLLGAAIAGCLAALLLG